MSQDSKHSRKVLIAPLDWGLGHATRCMPIIDELLLHANIQVHVATSGKSLDLLKRKYRNTCIFHSLPAYAIHYGKNGNQFTKAIIQQIPKIISVIKQENEVIKKLHEVNSFDLIISDNRYGVRHDLVRSIFMTHQFRILSGLNRVIDRFLAMMHQWILRKYDNIWIVDEYGDNAIAPLLSNVEFYQLGNTIINYIGHLSQFSSGVDNENNSISNKIVLLLSGPEPARQDWLMLFYEQATYLTNYQFEIISGDDTKISNEYAHIRIHGMCTTDEIVAIVSNAAVIVSRSGYSSMMDLLQMNKKSIVVPTPGQSEQVYVGQYLAQKKWVVYQEQSHFNLLSAIEEVQHLSSFGNELKANQSFKQILSDTLNQ